MRTFTNGSKIRVWDIEFTIVDLRDKPTMWQGDESYYGSSRTMILKATYGEADTKESQEWADATELENGEFIWIDGASYCVIVTDIKASNGLMFMTRATYDYTAKMFSDKLSKDAQDDVDAREIYDGENYDECRGY